MRGPDAEALRRRATIVFVGPGTPAMARAFRDKAAEGDVVLSDRDRRAFRAARLRRGLLPLLKLRAWRNMWRAWRAGFRQRRVQGDPWQHGGALVFDHDGALRHQQVDQAAGDALDLDALVAACDADS